MLYGRPELLHHILEVNCRAVIAYLNAQIEAGAQAVMMFDTWGGTLGAAEYREFSLAYMQRVVDGPHARAATASACRAFCSPRAAAPGSRRSPRAAATRSASTGRSIIGAARARVGHRVALQGNLDPAVLLAGPEAIRDGRRRGARRASGSGAGHVFNLGHGVTAVHAPGQRCGAGGSGPRAESGLSLKTRASSGFAGSHRPSYAQRRSCTAIWVTTVDFGHDEFM